MGVWNEKRCKKVDTVASITVASLLAPPSQRWIFAQLFSKSCSEDILTAVDCVQESILWIVGPIVDGAHQLGIANNGTIHKQKKTLFLIQLQSPAYHKQQLTHREINRHKILVFVNIRRIVWVWILFNNYRDSIRILVHYSVGFLSRLLFSSSYIRIHNSIGAFHYMIHSIVSTDSF